jgi:hypothetical protein
MIWDKEGHEVSFSLGESMYDYVIWYPKVEKGVIECG